jgi:hypothetical protein
MATVPVAAEESWRRGGMGGPDALMRGSLAIEDPITIVESGKDALYGKAALHALLRSDSGRVSVAQRRSELVAYRRALP